jgi:uncharacterized membrane protein YhaH (DUF805 family)
MLLYAVIFALAVTFQIRIPGELFLVFICVPRLHDIGRSGWWTVLPIACELAGVFAISLVIHPTAELDAQDIFGLATLAGLIVLFVPAIILLCIPGHQKPNRFGQTPAPGVGFASMVRSS